MKMKTTNRYTDEFKAQAVELAELGKPVSEVAADLGISTDLIYRWRKEGPKGFGTDLGSRPEAGESDELRRLKREVAHLKMENDILKKAAMILGTTLPQQKSAK